MNIRSDSPPCRIDRVIMANNSSLGNAPSSSLSSNDKAAIEALKLIINTSDLVVPPIIFLIGTFGNIFTIVVCASYSKLKVIDSMIITLAVCDELVVTSQALMWLLEASGLTPKQAWNTQSCQGIDFIIRMGFATSSWIIVFISLDRMIALRYTFSEKITIRGRHFIFMMTILTILNVVLYGHMPKTFALQKMVSGFYKCDISSEVGYTYQQLFYWCDSVYASLLPASLIIFFNAIILKVLHSHEKEIKDLKMANQEGEARKMRSRMHYQLTMMLVSVSICFLVTTLPYRILKPISKIIPRSPVVNKAIGLTLNTTKKLIYVNSAINFFIYLRGSKFRTQFVAIVRRRTGSQRPSVRTGKFSKTDSNQVTQSTTK